jgi:hypothetical protein
MAGIPSPVKALTIQVTTCDDWPSFLANWSVCQMTASDDIDGFLPFTRTDRATFVEVLLTRICVSTMSAIGSEC